MTWTRLHTATVVLLGLAFVGITVVRHGRGLVSSPNADTAASTTNRTRVQTFWRTYRKATEARTAGRLDSAAATYESALDRRPTHHDALYYLGHIQYTKNELRGALHTWQRLLEANPKSARGYTQIGEVHFCFPKHPLFDLDRAAEAYRRALDLHNEETRPLLRLGTISLLQDRPDAQKYLTAVRGANSNNPAAAFLVGYLAWQNDKSAQATILLRKAQNRYATQTDSGGPSCRLAERITAPLEGEGQPSSSAPSPYARLHSLIQQIRAERVGSAGS